MSVKSGRISLIAAIVFVALAVVILPGSFKSYRGAGTGHEFYRIYKAEGLDWDSMDEAARAPYIVRAKAQGLKYALLMTAGSHVPFFLLILLTIGLLTSSVSPRARRLLRVSFFVVWILGMLFLSFGVGYYQDIEFPKSLGSVFLIYAVVGAFFISIIVVVNRCTRREPKRCTFS